MAYLNKNYKCQRGEYGLLIITETGRCTEDEQSTIEANAVRDFVLEPLPNASGAILKSLDGTQPTVSYIQPSTMNKKIYKCVKIEGIVNPFANTQASGPHSGKAIHAYSIVYQEVGGVS